jgi:hypothetical protein
LPFPVTPCAPRGSICLNVCCFDLEIRRLQLD